jgi:Fe-S cluster assembly protein SufD
MVVTGTPHSLVTNRLLLKGLLDNTGPSWLVATREKGLTEFERTGIPTTKYEEWKYTSLRSLQEGDFKPAYGSNVFRTDLKGTLAESLETLTLAFVNGEYAPELNLEQPLPEGVVVTTLQEAFADHGGIIERYLAKQAGCFEGKLGANLDAPFVHLNTAYLGEGAFVYVPAGIEVSEPIQLLFVSRADHGPFACHPRVLIVLEEGAHAKVLETYQGIEGAYFTNAVTEIVVGSGATLEHTKIQMETPQAIHIATIECKQDAGSTLTSNNMTFGGSISRNDSNVWLNGERTETWLNGIYVGKDAQVLDNHTRIDHAFPNCNSFEVYKGVLGDHAEGVFNGKIYVYEDAQKTDAKQTNQALLLSSTAQINTKPQLEIFADDVKCTHGATVGQIREDAKFYLRARGIPEKQAEALLVYAFAAEALSRITIDSVSKALSKALYDKLGVASVLGD